MEEALELARIYGGSDTDPGRTSEMRFRYSHSTSPSPPITRQTSGRSLSLSINLLLHPYSCRGSRTALGLGCAKEEADVLNMAGLRNLSAPISIINLENEPHTGHCATWCLQANQPHTLSPAPRSAFKGTQEDPAGFGEGARVRGERNSNLKVSLAVEVLSMSRINLVLCF